jgi:nicotinamidase-related amidase
MDSNGGERVMKGAEEIGRRQRSLGAHGDGVLAETEWLAIVDMQVAFVEADSPWYIPGVEGILPRIDRLAQAFNGRVVCTRFVPPQRAVGSWVHYYERWPFALEQESCDLWQSVGRWSTLPTVDSSRFSKWSDGLENVVGPAGRLALCGVASDVCVMATALEAIDHGATVRVISDACAAQTKSGHTRAMTMLRGRRPQVAVWDTMSELKYRSTAVASC